MPSIFFQLSGLAYTMLTAITFLSKKNKNTLANLTYVLMIFITIIELTMSITYNVLGFFDVTSPLTMATTKLFYCAKTTWTIGFLYYIFIVTSDKKTNSKIINSDEKFIPFVGNMLLSIFSSKETKEELKKQGDDTYYFLNNMLLNFIIVVILDVLLLALPLKLSIENNIISTSGLVLTLSNIVVLLYILSTMILMLRHRKIVKEKKIKSFNRLAFFLFFGTIIETLVPEFPVSIILHGFAITVIYQTVENPDLNAIEKLNVATKQAESANFAKSNFLSSMSHEIRTPLNAIVGFSQALAKEDISGAARDEVKEILNASTGLLETINGILDVSKLEAHKVEVVKNDYSTRRLINEIVTVANNRLGSKPIELNFEISEKLPPVLIGDFTKLKQIILNILTNSIKYTKIGHITLKIDAMIVQEKCMLTIIIEDTGIGMTKEDLEIVFVKFQRFELDKNVNIAGTGLGMALTKGLVELMNGELNIESEYGKGTTTTILIEQEVSTKELTKEELSGIQKIAPFNAQGQKVLVVDDNKINLKVADRMLSDYKIDITLVGSGKECIDLIEAGNEYDIILLDIMMPKMKGSEVLNELKHIPGFKIPVVALTADAISGMEDKYIEQGFDDCLPKPIEEEDLFYLLKKYLKETIVDEDVMAEEKDENGQYITADFVPQESKIEEQKNEDISTIISTQKIDTEVKKNKPIDLPQVQQNNLERENEFELPKITKEITPVEIELPTIVEQPKVESTYEPAKETFSFNDLPEVNYLSEIMTLSTEQIFQEEQREQRPQNTNPLIDLLEKLEEYKNEENYELYAKAAKKIKDRANEQGLSEVSEMAYEHELAGKASYQDFINNNFTKLKELIEKTVK